MTTRNAITKAKRLNSKSASRNFSRKILLLGSGELGKELTISLKRLGQTVIAVDRYPNAPAMQVADGCEVINMLDGEALESLVQKHQPDLIVPEIEAIRTSKLVELEARGFSVIPTAEATHLTMNRNAIRDVAANELKVRTAKFMYANSAEELVTAATKIGFPNVVKPVMSSSGKGQSVVKSPKDVIAAWEYACAGKRGDQNQVIIEEFIQFDLEITLLTIKQRNGKTLFVSPIGHRQERGDYQESWLPAKLTSAQLKEAQKIAKKVTDRLGGAGLFGVEFFIGKNGHVYFSELSPRPHDTGMVTLISQDLSEFDLHARAILGLPIPKIQYGLPSASAVVLAPSKTKDDSLARIKGVEKALALKDVDVRVFGKPTAKPYRRMAVALARAKSTLAARKLAAKAAGLVQVEVIKDS
ncbi:MAG: formate-dependent phosphoribosylglycinamide formyltransferase [Bdellovibrionales bacterium]|jgi:phosphoribosylglycinamide formyltransferase 2|nr:formate-dependent phosphoribosylglycinamide formyltransferase [Bdellovibrionales bacterium]